MIDHAQSLPALFTDITYTNIAILVDTNTKKHCYPLLQSFFPPHHLITITPGESHKCLDTCNKIWERMFHLQLDRYALLINLGGGVICDIGGFCAAIYKRGIHYIHFPTTLLAQIDASIGGKVGINWRNDKNQLGVFKKAIKTIIYPSLLTTLPKRILHDGFFEMVKHALIADKSYWHKLYTDCWNISTATTHIARSIAIKSQIIEQDFQEYGIRKILNFGHTIGHALEQYYLHIHNPILHGEAVAMGIICEAYISTKIVQLNPHSLKKIVELLYPLIHYIQFEKKDIILIIKSMLNDKKVKNKKLFFVLLPKIGQAVYDIEVEQSIIIQSLQYLYTFLINKNGIARANDM